MIPAGLWKLLHLFFAFSFVGTLTLAEWNLRAARRTGEWRERARLLSVVRDAYRIYGLLSLLLLGVFGNLAAPAAGYSMRSDGWMHTVNGLWIMAVVLYLILALPAANRAAGLAQAAAGGGPAEGYEQALGRWRLANVLLTLLYIALLVVMVFPWRS
jgi:uncharacterized membrane protein